MKKGTIFFGRKLTGALLAGVLALGLLSGCGGNGNPAPVDANAEAEQEEEEGASGGEDAQTQASPVGERTSARDTIVVATENETPTLHTAAHDFVAASLVNLYSYNGLFRMNENMEVVPDLIDTYEAVTDTEWLFTLKEGVRFHNGHVLNAEDVKASLDWSKTFSEIAQYTASRGEVEVVDDLTFKIYTDGPTAMLLDDLTNHGNYIVPKELIDNGHDFASEPVGTGPYVFKNWMRGDRLEYEAFDQYFEDIKPSIKYLELRIIPEGASRTIALENGEVDFVVEVAPSDVQRLRENDNITLLEQPGLQHNYLIINNDAYPFDNVLVRRAINVGIDKEAIVEVATEGLADVVISQAPVGFPGSSEENAESYNPDLARQLLEESGVDPSEIVLDIICSNEQKRRAAEIIQANLNDLGIAVTISNMDLSTYFEVTSTTDFTGAIGNFTATNIITYLYGVHSSLMVNSSNRSRLSDPEVDRLMDLARTTIDDTQRADYIAQCIAEINALTPQAPLYQARTVRAYNKDLGGVTLTRSGTTWYNELYWMN